MLAELLFEGLFDLLLGGTVKLVVAAFCLLLWVGKALARVARVRSNTPRTERMAVDYVDAFLFPEEDQKHEKKLA